ncbi:aminotransferase-like domain-containing protein [Streptosporangium sp. NBC_01469]|uniref:aminotransferase-like domain-containing protein n=1 Tax=Streptosporangium sp. NBC_01469 TaxID=2903898 RepID=UPI002E2B6C4C|nr:PLP-dependent aminotransferase family protein [Streptosporangium sp. NBC_01469]
MGPIDLTEQLGRWSAGRGPLYVLLAARLRRLINDGGLPPGTPLPPDRALASVLSVGRNTVVAAYDLLHQEGRIVRRQGSGTRVAGSASAAAHDVTSAPVFLHLLEPRDGVILLACAAPDSPPPELVEAYERVLPELAATTGDIGYHPSGHVTLRRAITEHYERRGVPTEPDQILVTNGAQQALSLLARAFVRPGDHVLVEAPTYPGALEAFRDEAAVPRPLPVGLCGFEAAVREHRPTLAYSIPSFHNPTGAVLSPLSRRRLAETAAAADVPLIDDEVLIDLGFPGEETPPPLAAYADTVISVGSLSKIVWGGLRIGWVRAPAPVITRLARLRAVHDLGGDILAQLAAADLLPRLGALRRRWAEQREARHDHLLAQLARHLPDWDAPPVRGGQTLWVRLPYGDGTSFAQAAIRHRVAVLPGGGLDVSGQSGAYVRIHFLAPVDELSEAVRRLAEAWRTYSPPARRVTSPAAMAV